MTVVQTFTQRNQQLPELITVTSLFPLELPVTSRERGIIINRHNFLYVHFLQHYYSNRRLPSSYEDNMIAHDGATFNIRA